MTPRATSLSPSRLWTTVALLALANVIGYVDRVNLSVAVALPEFIASLHLSDTDRGLLNSAFWWAYAIGQVPAGMIVDRHGIKRPLAIGFVCWSLACAASGIAGSMAQIFVLRLVLGLCEAILVPAALRWMRYNMPQARQGLAIDIFTTASKVGAIIGVPSAAFLVGAFGWQGMFAVLGLGGMAWLIPWLLVTKQDAVVVASWAESRVPTPPLPFRVLLASSAICGTIIGAFCYSYAILFYFTWMPSYFLKRLGLSVEAMSVFSTVSFTGLSVIAMLAGWWRDRLVAGGRAPLHVSRAFVLVGLLTGAVLQLAGGLVEAKTPALVLSIISLFALGLVTVNSLTLTQSLVPAASIGRTAALQNAASSLGGVAVSVISGWLLEVTGSFVAPVIAISLFLFLGLLSYVFLVQRPVVALEPTAK